MHSPAGSFCALCADRTRGRTIRLRLTHGITVWLCEAHASPEFQLRRDGCELAEALARVWQASGCLTATRRRALAAHVALVSRDLAATRPRPGSYAWPELRARAEMEWARGAPPLPTIRRLRREVAGGPVTPPSERTMQRWHRERRWELSAAEELPAADRGDDVDARVGPERRLKPGPLAVDVDVHVPPQRRPRLAQSVAEAGPALVEAVDRLVHGRGLDVEPPRQVGEHGREGDWQVEVGHG
jgi:hypothetical protein